MIYNKVANIIKYNLNLFYYIIMLYFVSSLFFFQVPNEVCRIETFTSASQNKSGGIDVACTNFVAGGLPSLGYYPSLNSSLKDLFTIQFMNGKCKVLTKKTFKYFCSADYFAITIQNEADYYNARWQCYDRSTNLDYKQSRQQGNKRTMRFHKLSTPEIVKERDAIICDVQCDFSNVTVNILQTIEDVVVRKYDHIMKIDLHLDKYEYMGTYICQIAFPDNRTINGTGYDISIQGIYLYDYKVSWHALVP